MDRQAGNRPGLIRNTPQGFNQTVPKQEGNFYFRIVLGCNCHGGMQNLSRHERTDFQGTMARNRMHSLFNPLIVIYINSKSCLNAVPER